MDQLGYGVARHSMSNDMWAPYLAPERLRIGIIFATRGRAKSLESVIRSLSCQTRKPNEVVISAVTTEDLGAIPIKGTHRAVFGAPGLARQRNRGLQALSKDIDIVVFFDDDFLAHPRWLEVVENCFRNRPSVNAITGHVLADGIKGPGLSFDEARRAINLAAGDNFDYVIEGFSPYGCNMAFRKNATVGLQFDERLVLYGWLEDRDFGAALSKRGGKSIKLGLACGVHLGVKSGRMSGKRLGYSQVVNPIYMHRKGTITVVKLLDHLFRNITSNLVRSLMPEPHVDRIGRLLGNLIGARDLLSGVVAPERAELL